ANLFRSDDEPRRNFEKTQFFRRFGVLIHAPSEETDKASVQLRLVHHQLEPWNRRCKTRENKAAFRGSEDGIEAVVHRSLRGRISGVFGIRAVGEERQNALVSVCGECMQIEKLSVDWRRIDFEIARMNNGSGRRFDREGISIDD